MARVDQRKFAFDLVMGQHNREPGRSPRLNMTRFHSVFAPNSAHRAQVTPAKRGKG